MKKRFAVLGLAICFGMTLLLSGCGGKDNSNKADNSTGGKDTFTVAYRSEASNLDPHNNQSLTAFSIEMLIYDRLVDKDAEGNIVPSLATSWEEIDETTIRFHLRDDAYFHNGDKVTAEDVKYTIERAETMPGSSSFMSTFDGKNTAVVDEHTIDIKLHDPFAPIYNYLASARGCIVDKAEMEKQGSDAYGRNPIGSGAMIFSKWTAGDSIVLERNEKYWGDKTAYKTFIARFISEAPSRAIELETGGVDVAMHIAPSDMERLDGNEKVKIYNEPGYTFTMITINQNSNPILKDVRVREALYRALDVESIVSTIYGNTATPAYSIYSPQIMGYKSVGTSEYDPERAKELLNEAGYNFDTVLELITTDSSEAISTCEILRNMWQQVGINVNIVTYDQATLSDKVSAGDYTMQIASTSPSSGDPDHALWEWKDERLGFNTPSEIQDLIKKGVSVYDTEDRKKIYEEIQEKCWNYYGELPIAFSNVLYGTGSDVVNMDVNPGNVPNFSKVTFN